MVPCKFWTPVWMSMFCILAWGSQDGDSQMRLYVGNSRGADISIIDIRSLKVIGDINVGAERVHYIAVQPDGRRLFTTVESDHTLRIIDTTTNKIIGAVKVGGRPNQCAVTPNGKYVAVPIRDGDSMDIVDVEQQKGGEVTADQRATQCFEQWQ